MLLLQAEVCDGAPEPAVLGGDDAGEVTLLGEAEAQFGRDQGVAVDLGVDRRQLGECVLPALVGEALLLGGEVEVHDLDCY